MPVETTRMRCPRMVIRVSCMAARAVVGRFPNHAYSLAYAYGARWRRPALRGTGNGPRGPSGNRRRPPARIPTSPGPAARRWHLRRWGWGACCHAGACSRSPMEATARGAHTPFATLEGICKHRLFRLGKFALAFQFQRFQNSKRVFASNRNLNFPQRDQCY